jgi:hypothetical protein
VRIRRPLGSNSATEVYSYDYVRTAKGGEHHLLGYIGELCRKSVHIVLYRLGAMIIAIYRNSLERSG